MTWITLQLKTRDVTAPVRERRVPLDDTGSEEDMRRNKWEVERDCSLRWFERGIGETKCLADDVGTGEDVAFADEEACANDLSCGGVDTYQ